MQLIIVIYNLFGSIRKKSKKVDRKSHYYPITSDLLQKPLEQWLLRSPAKASIAPLSPWLRPIVDKFNYDQIFAKVEVDIWK